MVTAKCLPVLYLLITLPTSTPIGPAPASLPAWTRAMRGASSFSVAASRSSRLRARSAASTGLRQATSRSPGKSGGGDLGQVLLVEQATAAAGPSSAISFLMAGARSAVIHP